MSLMGAGTGTRARSESDGARNGLSEWRGEDAYAEVSVGSAHLRDASPPASARGGGM